MEIAGAIYALHAVSLFWPGRPILLCIDNSAAAAALVRGNCPSPIGASLASVFWAAAAAYSTPVWIEEVRSRFNAADSPSRQCALIDVIPNFTGKNAGVPDLFTQSFDSMDALTRFRFRRPTACQSMNPPWECIEEHGAETQ